MTACSATGRRSGRRSAPAPRRGDFNDADSFAPAPHGAAMPRERGSRPGPLPGGGGPEMSDAASTLPGQAHAFDAPADTQAAAGTPPGTRMRSGVRPAPKPPRSDLGTVILHWTVTAAVIASLLTGLRISADAPTAVVSKFLSPILPQGEVWTVHFVSSLGLFFAATA